jgi:hypothetical protein
MPEKGIRHELERQGAQRQIIEHSQTISSLVSGSVPTMGGTSIGEGR